MSGKTKTDVEVIAALRELNASYYRVVHIYVLLVLVRSKSR